MAECIHLMMGKERREKGKEGEVEGGRKGETERGQKYIRSITISI